MSARSRTIWTVACDAPQWCPAKVIGTGKQERAAVRRKAGKLGWATGIGAGLPFSLREDFCPKHWEPDSEAGR